MMSPAGSKAGSVFRILIVEDDPDRLRIIRQWMPPDVTVVSVTDAGAAMGLIRRDRGRVYSGIMLDHDLQEQLKLATSRHLCGGDVVTAIIAHINKTVPILVHSMNPSEAPVMVRRLQSAGYDATRLPMAEMTPEPAG